MMPFNFNYETIDCQAPRNTGNVNRTYRVVRGVFKNKPPHSYELRDTAWKLAKKVNPHKANDAISPRDKDRLTRDALGGVLAEYGWLHYINQTFGEGTVSLTEFEHAAQQIDLRLSNEKTIEVRSSFPRNGVQFAICNAKYNFKNICKYNNLYKPSEVDKDFFACVLFETPKKDILDQEDVIFYLIGGSTRAMMEDDSIAFETDLVAEDDLTQNRSRYKVIKLCNALDIDGFERYMCEMGYKKTTHDI